MAVVDSYTNSDTAAGKKSNAAFNNGAEVFGAVGIAEVASGDSNGSKYRVFKNLNPDLIIKDLLISHDAFSTSGACDLGLYESGVSGAAYDDDCLAAAINISSAGVNVNGLGAVDIANRQKKLFELAGHTDATKKAGYDLVITVDNVGATGAGTILLNATFIQG